MLEFFRGLSFFGLEFFGEREKKPALDTVENVVHFFQHCLVAVGDPDVGDVGPRHIVSRDSRSGIIGPEPVLLDLKKPRLLASVTL